jgi:S1-C subfamily serine protease
MLRRPFIALTLGLMTAAAARAGGLADLIDSAKPSIVAVGTYDVLKNPRFSFRGTGFVVAGGNKVVTNAHVLPKSEEPEGSGRLAVLVPRLREGPDLRLAKLLASDPAHDLALLEVDGQPMPALRISAESTARAGTSVVLIGFPLGTGLGFVPVAHRGIVAAIASIALPPATARQLDSRTLSRLREGSFDILQLDATAYPGNSGSPLLDVDTGAVIGVINMVYVKATKESAIGQPTGITYAIPAKHIAELLQRP